MVRKVSGHIRTHSVPYVALFFGSKLVTATCPAGKRVIGTGGSVSESVGFADPRLREIVPSDPSTVPGRVAVYAEKAPRTGVSENWTAAAYALCAD